MQPRVFLEDIQTVETDAFFLEMLREDSNLEMDWLWLATQVTADGQRAYCLRRALAINPESRLAQRGLARLRRRPGQPLDFFW
jgi:hypothetical protein